MKTLAIKVVDAENLALADIDAQLAAMPVDKIINLTQHAASAEQVAAGVIEPVDKAAVQAAITFVALPTRSEIARAAQEVAALACDSGCSRAMIGGAPFFMADLELALLAVGIQPLYAFSVRESVDLPDGSKTSVFRHAGWVEV